MQPIAMWASSKPTAAVTRNDLYHHDIVPLQCSNTTPPAVQDRSDPMLNAQKSA
jgi:hypothetical protein